MVFLFALTKSRAFGSRALQGAPTKPQSLTRYFRLYQVLSFRKKRRNCLKRLPRRYAPRNDEK